MDIDKIKGELKLFIKQYKSSFDNMGKRESQLLEVGALVMAAEHYKRKGYKVTPQNISNGQFRVKTGAKGHPANFSWFEIEKNGHKFEIHSNISVHSHYTDDGGVYVVDVGVVKSGLIPEKNDKKWVAISNKDLITFMEVKKLVIYPMLMAQFLGIVHEIKPDFLYRKRPNGFLKNEHFDPALVSIGYLHGTSQKIRSGFEKRGYKLTIVPAFDTKIAKLRGSHLTESPLGA